MMDIAQFVRTNKKIMIWATFFGLLYLVRKVFGLVFLTFLLCYIFNNAIVQLDRRFGLKRHFWTIALYLVFLSAVAGLFYLAFPRIVAETKVFFLQLPASVDAIHRYLDRVAANQPQLAPLVGGIKEAATIQNLLGVNRDALLDLVVGFFNRLAHYATYFLLATLFSFLILFDFPHLRERVRALRDTRFRAVYDETADSVARFAVVVGFTFQAQILIAVMNTLLTALGLWILGIESIALLSCVVFFAGLIPVWGTFISSVPILLLAFNDGGVGLAGKSVFMIVFVHVVEAYVLNPNIVSAVLKINPLLTLIILYLGHTLFGIWGLLLGVSVAVYVYRYIVMKPLEEVPSAERAECP
jgi:predicted PurR-regulated permease PerM